MICDVYILFSVMYIQDKELVPLFFLVITDVTLKRTPPRDRIIVKVPNLRAA
jgi:hypothetical protein